MTVYQWMRTICSRSVPAVLALYRSDAVLVPTYDNLVLQGHRELAAYFDEFLDKENLCGRVDRVVVQKLGDHHIESGIYTFRWLGEYGDIKQVSARFTFVFVRGPGSEGWQIFTHHSSELPLDQ